MSEQIEWFPTQGGTYIAYVPQWYINGKWEDVPCGRTKEGQIGVPQPLLNGGINSTLGLYGYDQAWALAYLAAADAAAAGKKVDIRLQKYEVKYDLEARQVSDDSE